ncbi:NUDIX hydrolase [Amycolatopsis sp. BJA-103]|uniref:NUDIX domain-containing protein n=1 Tax=unclassified Amycolatopsis TaxID=2618356 RepID=UPI000C756EAE|nr:NUDIX hydrolase [Amycolatopsis sp. BJA-103]AUI59916.1 NUDIX hydrolase [Amycolatopsis sp. BJA-103]PNE13731.1 NUDIX hydrolase [Amycolatopsis sp. BJA-103]
MELLPFDEYVRSLNRKRMAAGVLFRDDADRVLIVEPSYKEDWEIPGGACDEDEPPWRTAEREIGEELGITRPPGRLIAIDYLPSDERMPEGLTFVFDGGVITDEDLAGFVFADSEIVSAALVSLPEAALKLSPRLARRVSAALGAARSGGLAICEGGRPVS